ncbi:MAG: MFS transporter [Planctomycetota bacterium]
MDDESNVESDADGTADSPDRDTQLQAWTWIPTLYFASGLPYFAVASLATVMYANLGVSNADNAAYTSDMLWPWALKPFWSPLVDVLGTQRRWIVATQAVIAAALAGVALAIPAGNFFVLTVAGFWLLAIASATHDIAADGYYMSSMPERDQAWFVGIRSTFYRMSYFFSSGALVWLVGELTVNGEGDISFAKAWGWIFAGIAGLFLFLSVYHQFLLPRPEEAADKRDRTASETWADFIDTFPSFFRKPGIGMAIAYLLIYRFSEAQLIKLKAPFLLDTRENGGLALTNQQLGVLDGLVGVGLLTVGGIIGGIVVANGSLRRWLFPMALAINLPNAAYAYLAWAQPDTLPPVAVAIAFEQFGYGFGFAGYMLYMLQLSRGDHQTAHYAICTGFMALSMIIPGRFAGALQEWLGYEKFFYWVLAAVVPSLIITLLAPIRETKADEG